MNLTFDHGTVLVSDFPASINVSELPGLTWDPRVGAHRSPARNYAAMAAELARRGVLFSDDVRIREGTLSAFKPISLREYQARALAAWESAGRRGLLVLPTGSGKTRIAMAVMESAKLKTICLVPTRALLDQWKQSLASVYCGRIGCLGDGQHDVAPLTLATFESAYRWMPRIGNGFDLLVVDEAHHFGSGLRDEALDMCTAPARLGLTATPPQLPDARIRLEALLGRVVFESTIADLAGTYLSEFDVVTCRLSLDANERDEYARLMSDFERAHGEFRRESPYATWPEFVGWAMRTETGRKGLSGWFAARRLLAYTAAKRLALRELLARHARSRLLVFTGDNSTAYQVAREELIMPITCDIQRAERAQVLARFRAGELRALVSARVLNEGIDVPDAEVAVIVAGTLGAREHVQRVGRLLRPAPGKRATIYEFVTTGTSEVAQARRRSVGLAASASA